MNAVVTSAGSAVSALIPQTMNDAIRLAELMAGAKMVPRHLQGDVGTCLLVVEQAQRWQMSPFAVAQCTASIHGQLMFSGQLIAAAASATRAITGEFDYTFTGDPLSPESLAVTVTATRTSDQQLRSITLKWADAKTDNPYWRKQPEQQLCYAGARVWCRRWTPGVVLGVYAPEEFDRQGNPAAVADDFRGPTIDLMPDVGEPTPPREAPQDAQKASPPELKQTAAQWLDALEVRLRAAMTEAEVQKIVGDDEVQSALEKARGGNRERLFAMINAAKERTRIVMETAAEFLGDSVPEEWGEPAGPEHLDEAPPADFSTPPRQWRTVKDFVTDVLLMVQQMKTEGEVRRFTSAPWLVEHLRAAKEKAPRLAESLENGVRERLDALKADVAE